MPDPPVLPALVFVRWVAGAAAAIMILAEIFAGDVQRGRRAAVPVVLAMPLQVPVFAAV